MTALLLATSLALGAAQSKDFDLTSLDEASAAVVQGVVVDATTRQVGDDLRTAYTVATEEKLRGDSPGLIHFELPGGTLDGRTQRFSGVPTWTAGTEVVLFVPWEGPMRFSGLFTVDEGALHSDVTESMGSFPSYIEDLQEALVD